MDFTPYNKMLPKRHKPQRGGELTPTQQEETLRLWKEREANPNWQADERARLTELAPYQQKYDPKEYEARMRAQYPEWDDYTEATKRAIANAPFAKKQGELSGSAFAKAIIEGVNDPILAEGITIAAQFLIEGGVAAAKALLSNPTDLKGAVLEIIKKSAPAFAYSLTASHKNLTPAAEAVRKIAEQIAGHEGKGVLADVYATLTGAYPGEKDFMATIRKHADKRILTLYAMRTPINSVYQALIGAVSQGRFNEELKAKGYDQAMHLGLVVLLSDGTRLLLEKNERVKATANPTTSPTTQDLAVPLGSKVLTLGDLIGNTLTAVGSKQFFSYSPAPSGNCQRWCVDVLRSSGLLTPQLEGWILQDVGTAVKQLPWFTEHLLDAVALVGRGALHRTITGDHRFHRSRNSRPY